MHLALLCPNTITSFVR